MGVYRYVGSHDGETVAPVLTLDGQTLSPGDLVEGDYDGDNRFMAVASSEDAPAVKRGPGRPKKV